MRLIYPSLCPQCKRFFRRAGGCISIFEKLRAQATSSKFQTPSSQEAPSPKHQTPSSKLAARAAVWSLELGISSVFGAWFLVFRFRDFSGAWGLVLGVSLSGGSKTEMRPAPV